MFKTDPVLGNDQELLLRQQATKGNSKEVQKVLDRNKNVGSFNINSGDPESGNTPLHWACSKTMKKTQGNSEAYAKTIRLLIEYGADYLITNKSGQKSSDFFVIEEKDSEYSGDARKERTNHLIFENLAYYTLINAISKKKCEELKPIDNPGKSEDAAAMATYFYSIIDGLRLIDFFPPKIKSQDTFTILSLDCGFSTEIIPLILYFQYQDKQVNYIGIDDYNDGIEENKIRYSAYKNVNFFYVDTSDPEAINKIILPRTIDMGIMRNADFSGNLSRKAGFINKIVSETLPRLLKPLAPLLMTFQTEEELERCKKETQLKEKFGESRCGNNDTYANDGQCYAHTPSEEIVVKFTTDRFGFILNSNKTNEAQDQLSPYLHKLRM